MGETRGVVEGAAEVMSERMRNLIYASGFVSRAVRAGDRVHPRAEDFAVHPSKALLRSRRIRMTQRTQYVLYESAQRCRMEGARWWGLAYLPLAQYCHALGALFGWVMMAALRGARQC